VIQALLAGKLSLEQQNSEDLLTSMVFGMLEFVPAEIGLFRLLSAATTSDGTPPFALRPAAQPRFVFWPWLEERGCRGCEPDLLISVIDDIGQTHLIVIEAKYRSGKSSYADDGTDVPTDQLARQWDNLVHRCAKVTAIPHLVYITDHHGMPIGDIEHAADEFVRKRPLLSKEYPLVSSWLSWAHVGEVFARATSPILIALRGVATKYAFNFFAGVSPIRPICVSWRFDSGRVYRWPGLATPTLWRFVR
jgi:hypothetical protein